MLLCASTTKSHLAPMVADRPGPAGRTRRSIDSIAVVRQATLLSYLDDFKILGVLSLALLPLLPLVKPGKGVLLPPLPTERDRRPESRGGPVPCCDTATL
jgi:hypothetical protein